MKVRSLSKLLAIVFLSLIALIVLIVLLALSPLGVKTLVNVANDQPGIKIGDSSGSFYSAVVFENVNVEQTGLSLNIQNLSLDIGINCVFAGEACIESLTADEIALTLLHNTETSEASEPLNDYITLPMPATLDALSVGRLTVDQQQQNGDVEPLLVINDFATRVSMFEELVVHRLSVADLRVFATKSGDKEIASKTKGANLTQAEHWIHQLANYEYQAIDIPAPFVPLNARVENTAIDMMCLEQQEKLCLSQTTLQASVIEQLAQAQLNTQVVDQAIESLKVKASVNLADQFTHDIVVNVSPNKSVVSQQANDIKLLAAGSLAQTKLILSEDLSPSANLRNIVEIEAALDLANDSLPIDLRLSIAEHLPLLNAWLPTLNVPFNSAKIELSGDTQNYKILAQADIVSANASKVALEANASLIDKLINVGSLNTSGDLGELKVDALVKLADFSAQKGVYIDANLNFAQLQLQPLSAELDTKLNGNVSLQANMTPSAVWGDVVCQNIDGLIQSYDLSVLCDISINKQGLAQIKSLRLKQSDNLINAKGEVKLPQGLSFEPLLSQGSSDNPSDNPSDNNTPNKTVNTANTALELDINLSDLSTFHPSAMGAITGIAKVDGEAIRPKVNLTLDVDSLAFEQFSLESAQITLNTNSKDKWQSELVINAKQVKMNSESAQQVLADNLSINGKGNIDAHRLNIQFTHPDYALTHAFSGALALKPQLKAQNIDVTSQISPWRWQGKWLSGEFASAFDTLRLNKETDIDIQADAVSLGSHCWLSKSDAQSEQAISAQGLCIERAEYVNDEAELKANLTYNLSKPLIELYPEIIKPKTHLPLNTDIVASYSATRGLEAQAYSNITQAKVVSTKHEIDLVAIIANLSLKNQVVSTHIFAGTQTTGAIGFSSDLALDPENRTHSGQLSIDQFILSPLQRFIPSVEKLEGMVDGSIRFAGELTQPLVDGQINIEDVELYLDNYPYPISNFNQSLNIAANKASVIGDFELGSGDAQYNAELDFVDGIRAQGELKGAGMQLAFGKNEAVASPNLRFAISPDNIDVKGEVAIPNATIEVKELPKTAKSASSDTLIIGEAAPEPIVPIGIDVDVRIIVDPAKLKRVTIDAFDLQASLGGDLRVRVLQERSENEEAFKPLETYVNGEVNILSGSYEAYGQNLQIQKGNIFFSGSPNLPQFELRAIRNPLNTADAVIAGLRLTGNPVVPRVEIFSEPAMIQARQLSYLLNGTDLDGGEGTSNQVMLVNALVSFGVGNSDNGVNKLGKSLGFDSLNVQTAGQGDRTQVQLTGRLSENVQITYGVGVFDQASEVILKYQLLPKLYLEAKSGATSAVDLFYEVTRNEN